MDVREGLYVEGKLEDEAVNMTIDTGSSISLIKYEVLEKIGLDLSNVQPISNYLQSVTGEKKRMSGRITLQCHIGDRQFLHNFWVADIHENCILGLDFLNEHNCFLDLKDKVIKLGNISVPLLHVSDRDLDFKCYRVVALEDVSIPPQSEIIIPARVLTYPGGGEWGIIEWTTKRSIPGLMVGKTLATISERSPIVPVRMVNVSTEKRNIVSGKDIAKCEPVAGVSEHNEAKHGIEHSKIPEHLRTLYESSIQDLDTEEQKRKVYDLLCNNSDLFSEGPDDIGRTSFVKHKINTGNIKPIKQVPRRLPHSKRENTCQMISDMQAQGVIESSTSPWTSPVVLVKKKDGSLRFCVDYRKLNDVTIKDSYPLPRIDETLEALGGLEWFSTLDLKSGYWQVPMDEHDKEKTAFSTGGVYGNSALCHLGCLMLRPRSRG